MTKEERYQATAEQLVQLVGGKENIISAAHCATRLRLVLKDESKANVDEILKTDLVKGQFANGGQFQIIIGSGTVDEVYKRFIQITGLAESTKAQVKQAADKKMNPLQRLVKTLSDVFVPLIPALVASGLMMGLNNIMTASGLFFPDQSLVQAYPGLADLASMINTFAMSLLGIATSVLPMLFAIFLSEMNSKWFRKIVQTLTTLPNFISWVLVFSVAFSLFSDSGMVNTFLQNLGVITEPIKFLDSDSHTWLSMILWSTWKGLGWGAIMYLAAITSVDPGLYEAARIDGAGRFRLMLHITLPALLPTFFVLLMLSIANFLNNGMDQYYVFQNAFNKTHIQVLDLYVYNIGMTGRSLSLATANSMMKSIVSVTLLVIVNFTSKKVRGESII